MGPCLLGRLAVTTDVPDSGKMKTLGIFAGVVGIAIITGFFAAGGEKIWDKIFPPDESVAEKKAREDAEKKARETNSELPGGNNEGTRQFR